MYRTVGYFGTHMAHGRLSSALAYYLKLLSLHLFPKFKESSIPPPPMGDRLVVAVGLMGSEDPADSAF